MVNMIEGRKVPSDRPIWLGVGTVLVVVGGFGSLLFGAGNHSLNEEANRFFVYPNEKGQCIVSSKIRNNYRPIRLKFKESFIGGSRVLFLSKDRIKDNDTLFESVLVPKGTLSDKKHEVAYNIAKRRNPSLCK